MDQEFFLPATNYDQNRPNVGDCYSWKELESLNAKMRYRIAIAVNGNSLVCGEVVIESVTYSCTYIGRNEEGETFYGIE